MSSTEDTTCRMLTSNLSGHDENIADYRSELAEYIQRVRGEGWTRLTDRERGALCNEAARNYNRVAQLEDDRKRELLMLQLLHDSKKPHACAFERYQLAVHARDDRMRMRGSYEGQNGNIRGEPINRVEPTRPGASAQLSANVREMTDQQRALLVQQRMASSNSNEAISPQRPTLKRERSVDGYNDNTALRNTRSTGSNANVRLGPGGEANSREAQQALHERAQIQHARAQQQVRAHEKQQQHPDPQTRLQWSHAEQEEIERQVKGESRSQSQSQKMYPQLDHSARTEQEREHELRLKEKAERERVERSGGIQRLYAHPDQLGRTEQDREREYELRLQEQRDRERGRDVRDIRDVDERKRFAYSQAMARMPLNARDLKSPIPRGEDDSRRIAERDLDRNSDRDLERERMSERELEEKGQFGRWNTRDSRASPQNLQQRNDRERLERSGMDAYTLGPESSVNQRVRPNALIPVESQGMRKANRVSGSWSERDVMMLQRTQSEREREARYQASLGAAKGPQDTLENLKSEAVDAKLGHKNSNSDPTMRTVANGGSLEVENRPTNGMHTGRVSPKDSKEDILADNKKASEKAPAKKRTKLTAEKNEMDEESDGSRHRKVAETISAEDKAYVLNFLLGDHCAHKELADGYVTTRAARIIKRMESMAKHLEFDYRALEAHSYKTDQHNTALQNIIHKTKCGNKNDMPTLAAILHIKHCNDGANPNHVILQWSDQVRTIYGDLFPAKQASTKNDEKYKS